MLVYPYNKERKSVRVFCVPVWYPVHKSPCVSVSCPISPALLAFPEMATAKERPKSKPINIELSSY